MDGLDILSYQIYTSVRIQSIHFPIYIYILLSFSIISFPFCFFFVLLWRVVDRASNSKSLKFDR
jgi:hypothetical protein